MKAVVLAAGKGTRLRPITDKIPKVMIPIAGKPVLEHHIVQLAEAGTKEIFINLHHLPGIITSYFEDGRIWGVQIRYSLEREILGTAGAVKNLEPQLRGAPFLVVYGDNFARFAFGEFISWSEKVGGTGTVAVFEKEDVAESGIVDIDSRDRIVRFLEKPMPNEVVGHWVNAGIYWLDDSILDFIPPGRSDFGSDIFPAVLREGGQLFAYQMAQPVWAIDCLKTLSEARMLWGG